MKSISGKATCGHCGSQYVKSSRRQKGDALMLLALLRPMRCRVCMYRFYVPIWVSRRNEARDQQKAKAHSAGR